MKTKLLVTTILLCIPLKTIAATSDILIDATYKLVKDVSNLKCEVSNLKKEVEHLKTTTRNLQSENEILRKKVQDIERTLSIKNQFLKKEKLGSRKIILATFKEEGRAKDFMSQFQKEFKRAAVIKRSNCKRIGVCFVVYTIGDEKTLKKIRVKIPDAFFARE